MSRLLVSRVPGPTYLSEVKADLSHFRMRAVVPVRPAFDADIDRRSQ
jgi:hypothetical protein